MPGQDFIVKRTIADHERKKSPGSAKLQAIHVVKFLIADKRLILSDIGVGLRDPLAFRVLIKHCTVGKSRRLRRREGRGGRYVATFSPVLKHGPNTAYGGKGRKRP